MSENHDQHENASPSSNDNTMVPANTAADSHTSGPDGFTGEKRRVSNKQEILYKLDNMPGLVATGLLPTPRANAMRAIYQTMLANLNDSSPGVAAAIADEDLVAVLRTQPDLLKVLKPFLTPQQMDLIIREATDDQ